MRRNEPYLQDDDVVNVLRSSGRNRNHEDYNKLEYFYKTYNSDPCCFQYDIGVDLNYNDFISGLQKKYDEGHFSKLDYLFISERYNTNRRYTILHIIDLGGAIITLNCGLNDTGYSLNYKKGDEVLNIIEYSDIISDGKLSDEYFKHILDVMTDSRIEEYETVNIGMIAVDNGSFYVKDFDIKSNTIDIDDSLMDLHYGDGFGVYYKNVLDKLLNSSKGLTLFHGEPGTGKTTMIRHLIMNIMNDNKKNKVLYFPPTMVDSVTDPQFINFLADWAYESEGKVYLLIEDAEPLLESRNQSRNMGITNLLNMTDGILNDILNIQIIATFNTKLENLDTAILRPGRLLARKEFNKLTKEQALKIAEHVGIDTELIKDNMTLADIYTLKKDTSPLTHNIVEKKTRLGFK